MKQRMNLRYSWLLALGTLASCQYLPLQRSTTPSEPLVNKFGDASLQRIYTLQDERKTSELLPFLSDPNTAHRAQAALAFG